MCSFYGEQGVCSSIATTLNTPLLLGGPSSVSFCPLNKYEQSLIVVILGGLVLDPWICDVLYAWL